MKLLPPFEISPSLSVGLKIGDGWLEYRDTGNFVIVLPDNSEIIVTDFQAGSCRTLDGQFSDMLVFLSGWVHALRGHYPDENIIDFFDTDNQVMVKWAKDNEEELEMLTADIDEASDSLIQ